MKNPKKDPKIKAIIMKNARGVVNKKDYPKDAAGEAAYEAEVMRVYNEQMNK